MRRLTLVPVAMVLMVLLAGCSISFGDGAPSGDATTQTQTTEQTAQESTTATSEGTETASNDSAALGNLLQRRYPTNPYGFVLERRTVYGSDLTTVVRVTGSVDIWGHVLMEGYVETSNGSSSARLTRRMFITPLAGSDQWKIYNVRGANYSICTTNRFNFSGASGDRPVRFAYPNVSKTFQWHAAGTQSDVRVFEAESLSAFGREQVGVAFDSVSATLRVNTSAPRIQSYRFNATVTRNGSTVTVQETWTRRPFGYWRAKELGPTWIHTDC